jgi:hypothetical protein
MAETNGSNGPDRLTRVEVIIEALADRQHLIEYEFARLLRAQVVMGDQLDQMAAQAVAAKTKSDEEFAALRAAQKHADERMDALVMTVDEIIRGRKPQ